MAKILHINFTKRLIANLICVFFTLLSFGAASFSPEQFGWAGFLALTVPIWLIVHFVFFAYWLTQRSFNLIFSTVTLFVGFPFWQSTIAIDFSPMPEDTTLVSVLSYNVRVFNVYDHLQDTDSLSSKEMIHWVAESSADIKCLQEVYNEDSSSVFNTVQRIAQQGKYNYYLTPTPNNNKYKGGFFGLAIFSKFPILNSGEIPLSKNRGNRCLFIDVKTDKDTLRVYNLHLQSMSIDENKLLEEEDYEGAKKTYMDLYRRLKRGFESRAIQVEMIKEHIQQSPYPVIVCGDFNETPYSYVYQTLRNQLNNAFEKGGNGFGFSYNGKLFFLRIDNQFFDKSLKIKYFKTFRNVPYSDHFPILGVYEL